MNLLAGALLAATVGVQGDVARYVGAPGERSNLRVRASDAGLLLRDRQPMRAGAGCREVEERAVVCDAARIVADLGDRWDRAVARTPGTDVLRGGPGLDVLATFKGADVLRGGAFRDILVAGGRGVDVLGGPGPDTLAAGPGVGRVDCGGGVDIVSPLGLDRRIPRSCEFFEVPTEEGVRARIRDGYVPVPECQLEAGRRCRVRVTVHGADRVIARRTTRERRVRIRVPAGARWLGVRYRASGIHGQLAVRLPVVP